MLKRLWPFRVGTGSSIHLKAVLSLPLGSNASISLLLSDFEFPGTGERKAVQGGEENMLQGQELLLLSLGAI